MLRRTGAAIVAALLGFHAWLLAGLIIDGSLADPSRLLRWAGALALLAAFATVSRTGDRAVRRRRLVALWILAALLHAPALSERLDDASIPSDSSFAILTGGIAPFVVALVATALFRASRATRPLVVRARAVALRSSFFAVEPAASPFAPRPPSGLRIFFLN